MESHKGRLALLCLMALLPSVPAQGPVVQVEQGQLQGRRDERPYAPFRTIYTFEGVPYARAPLGELRFKDPEEPQPWDDVRNATSFGNVCIQLWDTGITGSEDCLYLNIYTVDPPESWQTIRRPVMVWIHGGAFLVLSGNTNVFRFDPVVGEGVVVVSLNYRLGVFGFLNTEDAEAPGNAGLKDQTMALRWVQRNIAVFGGDPSNVTIMGQSAGGISVHFHMMSQLSKGLFHKAISLSGTVLTAMVMTEDPRRQAVSLRRTFNDTCGDLPDDSIVGCLQRIDAAELVVRQFDQPENQSRGFFMNRFFPSVERPASGAAPFLIANPYHLLREGRFARVPYMAGFTSAEGIAAVALTGLLTNATLWAEIDQYFQDYFIDLMPPPLRTREAVRKLRHFYFGNRSLSDTLENLDTLQRAVQLITDVVIDLGIVASAEIMAKHRAPIYVYEFSRDGPIAFTKDLYYNASYIDGVAHGDDLVYVFDFMDPVSNLPLPVPADEQPLRDRQATIFANMIKTGNPTPPGSGLLRWPLYTRANDLYVDMDVELRVRRPPMGERIGFWRMLAREARASTGRGHRQRGRKG